MRIIGGRDYYDSAVPYDTDNTRIFKRDVGFSSTRTVEHVYIPDKFNFSHFNGHGEGSNNSGRYWIKTCAVIFCGKRYNGIRVWIHYGHGLDDDSSADIRFFWSADKFLRWMEDFDIHFSTDRWSRKFGSGYIDREDKLRTYFNPFDLSKETENKLVKQGVVYMTSPEPQYGKYYAKDDNWLVNSDNLKSMEFNKAMDPWSAYQEIDMYLGSTLVSDVDAMVRITDKDRIAQHGFDKWSFKNPVHQSKPRGK